MIQFDYAHRLHRLAEALEQSNFDTVCITPGADLTYLTGYEALPLERLTCLVVKRGLAPVMIVPGLERPAAVASGVENLGIDLIDWAETENPYTKVNTHVHGLGSFAVNNLMSAQKAVHLGKAAGVRFALAENMISALREVKGADEIAALHEAGATIDRVHARMHEWLRPGRTEREVGADIAEAIIAEGHATVDFVIVASGPNGASPHHEVSDRVIQSGEQVVVDIGGTMPSGYCSDSTRMYSLGEPSAQYAEYYAVLQRAQAEAVAYARAGVSAESVDAVARNILTDGGLGEYFIHRTGHGIGLETHEEPYIVSGNTQLLEPGHAFSIEPGFYIPGQFGARIEDIVTCNADGVSSANNSTHDLVIL